METAEILKALERNTGTFPREALDAAVQRREEITPELLRILEDTVARAAEIAEEDTEDSYFAFIYAMFLLAQFRETRAYPLVVQFARLPEDTLDNLVSDFITEDLPCVLASVCGGDTTLIESLIESPDVHGYVRSAAVRSFLVLVAAGDKTRDEVMAYFKTLFDERLEREFSRAWNSLVTCATDLYPDEVYDRIVAAYEEGLVEGFYIRLADVDEVLAVDRQAVLDRMPTGQAVYIQDVVEEMEWWHCFNPPKRRKRSKKELVREPKRLDAEHLFHRAAFPNPPKISWPFEASASYAPEQAELPSAAPPIRSEKIKPNERCPCGSGKKYKKCCGRRDVDSGGRSSSYSEALPGDSGEEQESDSLVSREEVTFDPYREAQYIIKQAQEGVICVVVHGRLAFFSTTTGDAWMLDPEDGLALWLAKDRDRYPFRIEETDDEGYIIEWSDTYRIEGNVFVVIERSGRIRSILGYPTEQIERAIRSSR